MLDTSQVQLESPRPKQHLLALVAEHGSGLRQPWLHELSICVDGNGTALSAPDGSMNNRGAEGFFVDDQRVLSTWLVTVGGEAVSPVAQASRGPSAEFFGSARGLGDRGADPTVEVHRRRHVSGPTLTERIEVVSRATDRLTTELTVTVASDGAELGAVKSGHTGARLLEPTVMPPMTVSWCTERLTTAVRFDPKPESLIAGGGTVTATFELELEPGATTGIEVSVTAERTGRSMFPADAGSDRHRWDEQVTVAAADPRLGRLISASLADLRSLLLTDPADTGDVFAAAGTPWYLTLFGRDSIWAARLGLPLGTALAGGTLRALARRQGTAFDPRTAEAPGKIPHELRRAPYEDDAVGFSLPPIYYGTVDATALWICLCHDAWRWGLPTHEVRDLLPNLRAAARWLTDLAAPDEDGLIKYVDESGHGLVNQGWKDSGDSMRFRDGRLAQAPIALLEAQAYAVEAARAAAALLRALGDADDSMHASSLVQWSEAMEIRIRERFWVGCGDDAYLAMAIDAAGDPVDGLGSNMGHVLGTGTLTANEASRVVEALIKPAMLGPYGIVTMASDNGGFNPIGYHTGSVWVHDTAICALGMAREGHTDEAATVAGRLLDVGELFGYRFPELIAGAGPLGGPAPYPASCRPQAWACASAVAILTLALGLSADVPNRTLTVRPPRSAPFGALTVTGLRVAESVLTIRVDSAGGVEVEGMPEGFTLIR
jgi:glycogen debranching enzyme